MDKNITWIVIIVTIIIIVAVVMIMKNNENSKKMEALIREAELRSIEREAEYNARKKDEPDTETTSTIVNPPTEDIEIIGDQSLVLDEDPSDEYDEMANDSGIVKIAPPRVDNNWVETRKVEPSKDLSVGIAITNDVSKKENLQTGKTTSKFPIKEGTGVRTECADGKCGDPSKYPTQMRMGSIRRMDGTYSNINMEALRDAARNAAQKRDSDIKRVLDEKVRSQAKSAAMKQREYVDTSRIKQYDVKPSKAPPASLMRPMGPSFGSMRPPGPSFGSMRPPGPSFGSMRPTGPSFGSMRPAVMPPDHAMKIRKAAMEAAAKAEKEERMKADMEAQRVAMEAAAKAEKEERMKAEMEAQRVAMEAAAKAEKEERMKAEMEAQRVAMEAAAKAEKEKRMEAEMEAQRVAMEAEMEAQRVAMEAAAAKVEGYEMMKPLGSMVY